MDEIGKLRRSKKMAAGVDKKGEQAGLTEKRVDELRAEIKEYDNELNAVKEEQVSCEVPFQVFILLSRDHTLVHVLPRAEARWSSCRCSVCPAEVPWPST